MYGRKIVLLYSVLWLAITMQARDFDYSGIVLDHMVIQGKTNINDFMFSYINDGNINHHLIADTLNDSILFFKVPVGYITAKNPLMENNFRDLIKASKYPYIDISINKSEIKAIEEGRGTDKLKVVVTIAGKSNSYCIPCFLGYLPERYEYVMGKTKLNLTDYDLEPSQKIFGLIKVSNEVFINFRVNFKPS